MQFYEMNEIPYMADDGSVQLAKNDVAALKSLTTQRVCYQCNKKFDVIIPAIYVYRLSYRKRTRWFCGWNCLCAFRKDRANADGRKKKREISKAD